VHVVVVGCVAVLIRRQQNNAAIERDRPQLDVEARSLLMGEGGADSPCGSGPCYRVGVRTDDETFSLVVTGTVLTQSRHLAVR
jgi:hypothetical protein